MAALLLLFLIFITLTYDHSKAWNALNRSDQGADLQLGLQIRHFQALSDGNRHPLLPALVAPFAEADLRYFTKAKLVNVAIGAAAFGVVAWVGLRWVGPGPTCLALMALSPGLSDKSAEFTVEPLLLLLVTLTAYWLVKGFERPRLWALAGAFAGLAHLTKGSAPLLLLAYTVSVLWMAPAWVLSPRFLLFPLAYGVVASPLLLYNWQVFGSPFFNHNTAHEMWLDAAGQLPLFDQGPPTMLSYLAAHSAGQILWRFLSGLVRVRGIEWVWPFLLVFLCLPRRWLTYFRVGHEKRTLMVVATTLVLTFYLPFAWYAPVWRGMRFLLPVFPLLFLLLADFLLFYGRQLATWWWDSHTRQRLAALALTILLVVLGGAWLVLLSSRHWQPPLAMTFEDQATAEVYQLLDTPAFDSKRVLFGPSHELTGPWLFHHQVAWLTISQGLPASAFLAWLRDHEVDYILANRPMIQQRADIVYAYLTYTPAEGVQVIRREPGWEIIYQGPRPSRFILVRVR